MLTQQLLSISLQHTYSPNNKRHNQTLYGTEMIDRAFRLRLYSSVRLNRLGVILASAPVSLADTLGKPSFCSTCALYWSKHLQGDF
jgi:hypothetical protein